MDEEIVKTINRILNIVENHGEKIDELSKQVGINCTKLDNFEVKLDKIDNKLDQLQEIGEKNQNSINELIKLNRQNI